MSKKIQFLIIHCTATPENYHVTKNDIIKWHTSPKKNGGRGWKVPGYSDVVYLNGDLHNIIPYDQDDYVDSWEITNGVKRINGISRHVVYVGGVDINGKDPKDTRTKEQLDCLRFYVKYNIVQHPHIRIAGHNQFANKACPSFDVPKWLREIGIDEKNIYEE